MRVFVTVTYVTPIITYSDNSNFPLNAVNPLLIYVSITPSASIIPLGLLLVIFWIACVQSQSSSAGHCIWYDQCYSYYDEDKGKTFTYNCPYDGPGKKVQDIEAREILRKRCPNLYQSGLNDLHTLTNPMTN